MARLIVDYPEWELGIFTLARAYNDGIERVQEGDIVVSRLPVGEMGTSERHRHLWLRIQGWDRGVLERLTDPWYETSVSDPLAEIETQDVQVYAVRRYCIPLTALANIYPALSLNRTTDYTDAYQPFMPISDEAGQAFLVNTPLDPNGLIFDKLTQKFLYWL